MIAVLDWIAELVAPSTCAACDEPERGLFCAACHATVERPIDERAVFVYGGAVAEAIVRLKYRGRSDLASRLGRAMLERAPRAIDLVVPVPLHPLRAAERGFNQSALLARPIAKALGVPLGARVLERVRHTPRQATLARGERRVNVRSAFRCRAPSDVAGKRVLLVDDVRTTGATLSACREALEDARAREIVAFVLAVRDELPDAP